MIRLRALCSLVKAAEKVAAAEKAATAAAESARDLKGVMRIGLLAKGLLLHGDLDLQLVVLCNDRPTKALLWTVAERLPEHLAVGLITL